MIRKATMQNIDAVAQIYDAVHDAEESGALCIGWDRSVYPVRCALAGTVPFIRCVRQRSPRWRGRMR